MQRSTDRIRTTHVGSLARPAALLDLMRAGGAGQPVDPAELAEQERLAVADVVARQRAAGLDVISPDDRVGQVRGAGRGRPPGHRPALALAGRPPS